MRDVATAVRLSLTKEAAEGERFIVASIHSGALSRVRVVPRATYSRADDVSIFA